MLTAKEFFTKTNNLIIQPNRKNLMKFLQKHVWQCFVAGVVALLPIGGIVITIVYFEKLVAAYWLEKQGYYFFGLGLLAALIAIYLVGLFFSNVIGQWIWNTFDRVIDRMPILGNLYKTLKQILGYGEGEDALFERVVFVQTRDFDGEEIGLVTNDAVNPAEGDAMAVFIPFSPSPMNGRLVFVDRSKVRDSDMSVNQAMKSLVSLGSMLETTTQSDAVEKMKQDETADK